MTLSNPTACDDKIDYTQDLQEDEYYKLPFGSPVSVSRLVMENGDPSIEELGIRVEFFGNERFEKVRFYFSTIFLFKLS